MKTMTMENAVEYSLDKDIVIHVPTQELWNSLGEYVKKIGAEWLHRNWFPEYGHDTCVNLGRKRSHYDDLPGYKESGYEIIELIDEPVKDDTLIITIKSDGYKVVSASCNNITTTAKCNDSDTFNLSKGSHMALKRLIDKMNEPSKPRSKFKVGDIVEVLNNTLQSSFCAPDESIGLQGIVTMTYEEEGIGVRVKFPVRLHDGFEEFDEFEFDEDDLKLIRRA